MIVPITVSFLVAYYFCWHVLLALKFDSECTFPIMTLSLIYVVPYIIYVLVYFGIAQCDWCK